MKGCASRVMAAIVEKEIYPNKNSGQISCDHSRTNFLRKSVNTTLLSPAHC